MKTGFFASVTSFLVTVALLAGYQGVSGQFAASAPPREASALQATITGPDTITIGTLVTLTADVQGATIQRWYPINPAYDHACETGLTITGDRPESRKYALFIANGAESMVIEHQVQIVAADDSPTPIPPVDNPCPPPNPPGPQPPIPPSPAELTLKARAWLLTVPAGSLARKAAIVSGVQGVIGAVSSGSLKTVAEVDQNLRAVLISATKLDTGWMKFGLAYNAEIEARKADGRISDAASYAVALSQIVEGLQ